MKKVEYIKLEVVQRGLPSCDKQSLEILDTGHVVQTLYPMVYFGQPKVYQYDIDSSDAKEFLATIDPQSWQVHKRKNRLNVGIYCIIRYSDGTSVEDRFFRTDAMGESFTQFDAALLEMVPFIEKPWLFTE